MSCFGGLSPVLSSIGTVLRLHCGRIVCAPSGSGQESYDQYALGPGLGPDGADGDHEGPIDGSQNGLTGEHAHLNGSGMSNAKQLMRTQDRSLMRGRSGKQELQFSSILALPWSDCGVLMSSLGRLSLIYIQAGYRFRFGCHQLDICMVWSTVLVHAVVRRLHVDHVANRQDCTVATTAFMLLTPLESHS